MCFNELHFVAGAMPNLDGDSYHEPDDVVRGYCLSTCAVIDAMTTQCDAGRNLLRAAEPGIQESCGASDPPTEGTSLWSEFQFRDGITPPNVLADTTVFFENDEVPVEVGSKLLGLLEGEIGTKIELLSAHKFSTKAETCRNGLACVLKVRLYLHKSGFAIEFQRRVGDGIAFNTVFRGASEYLTSKVPHGASEYLSSFAPSSTISSRLPSC